MRSIYNTIIFLGALLLAGCSKDYLEIKPKGKMIPSFYKDYRLLLNDAFQLPVSHGFDELATDNVEFYDELGLNYLGVTRFRLHTWQNNVYTLFDNDREWADLYKQIYLANVVLEGFPSITDGAVTDRNQLKGEALVHRAFAYFCLVNQYGNQFDSATAANDLGVPLLLAPSTTEKLNRASVKKVYDQIITDLTDAVDLLSVTSTSLYEPRRATAMALLARTFLQAGNYSAAEDFAKKALALNSQLTDYNNYTANPRSFPISRNNPETYLVKIVSLAFATLSISDDLQSEFTDPRIDLRFQFFFNRNGIIPGYLYYDGEFLLGDYRSVGPTVPEVLLIRAECAARFNRKDDAMADVNKLREMRIRRADYTPLAAVTPEEALKLVLAERRRELAFKGLRFIDLKRLNKDPRFAKTLSHDYEGVHYEIAPNDYRYLFPIAPELITLNPELEPNKRN